MGHYLLGIDVGGTNTKIGLFSVEGQLCARRSFPTRETGDRSCYSNLVVQLNELVAAHNATLADIAAVGVALPGTIDEAATLALCPNLDLDLQFYTANLRLLIPGIPLVVLNDANAAAVGEGWQGCAVGIDDFLMVTLGTGVGGGIVQSGKPYFGNHGAAGEIGHLCVCPTESEACSCGRRGCLEQYASGSGIVRRVRRKLDGKTEKRRVPTSLAALEIITPKEVFDHARAGDVLASEAVAEFIHCLGFGLAQIACVIDPELIVVGGGLSASAPWYLDDLTQAFEMYALSACRKTPVVMAQLGNDCGIFGAAAYALDSISSTARDCKKH
ncbi:MAG: ROK family protein [Raoultibacter sp.]